MVSDVYLREFYVPGRVIIKEGSPGHELFIIESGHVIIYKMLDGEKKILATLEKGQVFGEMALVDLSVRMASAEAFSDGATLVKISSLKFTETLEQCPVLIQKVVQSLVGTLRRVQS